ncbi:MAG TPA: hypothetical protein VFI91_11845, partial [Longimicrobiaceae bacterium]|nr:hypothetical protein [Longimicrobiaceae bacterium]
GHRSLAISYQLSAISYQLSAISNCNSYRIAVTPSPRHLVTPSPRHVSKREDASRSGSSRNAHSA